MGFFEPYKGAFLIERRTARRTRATCVASLRTLTRESIGHLWDLSETGARVSVDVPPEVGESAVLKWGGEKVMCRVVWTEHDMCGLSFDTPIESGVVASSARLMGIVEQPVAEVGNIPIGRRRSAPGTSQSECDPSNAARPNLLASRRQP
jgi:hypothetical protein